MLMSSIYWSIGNLIKMSNQIMENMPITETNIDRLGIIINDLMDLITPLDCAENMDKFDCTSNNYKNILNMIMEKLHGNSKLPLINDIIFALFVSSTIKETKFGVDKDGKIIIYRPNYFQATFRWLNSADRYDMIYFLPALSKINEDYKEKCKKMFIKHQNQNYCDDNDLMPLTIIGEKVIQSGKIWDLNFNLDGGYYNDEIIYQLFKITDKSKLKEEIEKLLPAFERNSVGSWCF